MSIFKDTFKKEVRDQLKVRQDAFSNRTPAFVQFHNAATAWIRMTSAVNVDGSPDLARKYILQGGTLYNNSPRAGVGLDNQAYSIVTPNGTNNRLGLRPMPGITSIDVKSKSAYGSLKEVVVNFQCWDIRQLEDLELLYMRPNYSVLVEWGWMPYLDNNSNLINNIDYYDIINTNTPPSKEKIFKDLYEEATKKYYGNYDALFGSVRNYSWRAREDGGYDCTTTIISIGEVLESLKVNYAPIKNAVKVYTDGLIASKITTGTPISLNKEDLKKEYSKNVLAGLFYELFEIVKARIPKTSDLGASYSLTDNIKGKSFTYNFFKKTLNIKGSGAAVADSNNKIGASDEQVYITLEGLCDLLNNYVIPQDSKNNPYLKCSVHDREYLLESNTTPNRTTGNGYLLCLAHPLQLSMDPTVCLIKSTVWPNGFKINPDTIVSDETERNLVTFPNSKLNAEQLDSVLDQLYYVSIPTKTIKDKQAIVNYLKRVTKQDPETVSALTKRHYEKLQDPNYKIVRPKNLDLVSVAIDEGNNIDTTKLNKSLPLVGVPRGISLYNFLFTSNLTNLTSNQIQEAFGNSTDITKSNPVVRIQNELTAEKNKTEALQKTAIKNLEYLKNIENPYFYQNDWQTELGIIGNIYVNLNYLYRLALDNNLESTDTKEKKDINLYNFLKSILSEISSATGNVNNFDLYVENNTAYIIDVNYVDFKPRSEVYEKIFQLEMHNLKSTVRSYSLESQIFPDQSTIVAIGAQAGGGALSSDNNTMAAFNKGLTDRVMGTISDPITDPNQNSADQLISQLKNVNIYLQSLYDFFGDQSFNTFADGNYDIDKAADYKNSLKDLINVFLNLTKSNIKNRAIIPTKLSITMDGIGGLVIGHLFKIPEDLLPRGYKGETLGSKLGYVVTGIGHSIKDNDWATNIDAQTIILDEPEGTKDFIDLITVNTDGSVETVAVTPTLTPVDAIKANAKTGGYTKNICGRPRVNGRVEDILVDIRSDLYSRHYSSINQSDNKRIRLQPNAIKDLEKLLTDAYNAGIYIKINSAYRTYDDQVRIKNESKDIPAAPPGTSNHGFGLAVDLADKNGVRINPTKTPKEWAWIQANKIKYGFENINNDSESHHYNYLKPGTNC